jgi:ABC-type transport system substrate-binding protein
VQLVRVGAKAQADLGLLDEVARYTGPNWVFNRLHCAVRQPCAPEADALAAQAQDAETPAEILALAAEAERAYADANVYIPLGQPVRYTLVAGNFSGFAINRWAYHPLYAFSNRPK